MSAPILMFYILYSSSYLHGTACDCCDKLNYSNILAHRALKTISDIRKGNYRIDFMFGVYHGNSVLVVKMNCISIREIKRNYALWLLRKSNNLS